VSVFLPARTCKYRKKIGNRTVAFERQFHAKDINSDVSQSRQNADTLRKKFLAAQNARLRDDPNLSTLRVKIENLSQEIKTKRKRMHQAPFRRRLA
jgi:hypothetical protein